MAVLPSEVTVTAVVATTNITPAEGERETANQGRRAGHVSGPLAKWWTDRRTDGRTFVHHGVVEEAASRVLHSQAVPQREVVDGEKVVLVGRGQELPAEPEIFIDIFF